jgi:hypothetical protein
MTLSISIESATLRLKTVSITLLESVMVSLTSILSVANKPIIQNVVILSVVAPAQLLLSVMTLSMVTFSISTFSIPIFIITTLSMVTFSINTLRIVTFSIARFCITIQHSCT